MRAPKQFFVTGIGTGVGKSFCTAAMLHQAPHFRAVKPVMSGYDASQPSESDAGELLAAMRQPISEGAIHAISPYRFAAPLSPHLAAEKEGKTIAPEALIDWCLARMREQPHLLIEGVGGLMVPLNGRWRVLEWMCALNLPVIVIAGSYLGAINHTLLTLDALDRAGLPLHALLLSQSEECAGLEESLASITPYLPKNTRIGSIKRIKHWKDAPDLLPLLA